jgi:hypothetical protein
LASAHPSAGSGRTRIWVGDPAHVGGAGILVAPRQVITCWHVIHPDGPGTADVSVDFPDSSGRSTLPATMDRGVPVDAAEGGDLALLELSRPTSVVPARLTRRHAATVRVFGYPGQLSTGVWARATVAGAVDEQTGWYQLDAKEDSVPIEQGFSGAAVFDDSGSVIGMVAAIARWPVHSVAWMIPVERWQRAFPDVFIERDRRPRDPVVLTFAQKHALSRALADLPIMADVDTRRRVVFSLPPEIRAAVPSFSVAGVDLFGIVDAVTQFPDGFRDLFRVVAAFAGSNSAAMARVRQLAVSYDLLEDAA